LPQDWAGRAVLEFGSPTPWDVSLWIAALQEALTRFGRPGIFNANQSGQFTALRARTYRAIESAAICADAVLILGTSLRGCDPSKSV